MQTAKGRAAGCRTACFPLPPEASSQVWGRNPTPLTYSAVYFIYIRKHIGPGRQVMHLNWFTT